MPNLPVRLTLREQYALAYRFVRLHLAAEINPAAQEKVFLSFGISPSVGDAAHEARTDYCLADFGGWRNLPRQWDFEEARGVL